MNKLLKKLFAEPKLQIALIAAVTFLVYANSLFNGLVWDDHLFLENWPDIRSTQGLAAIFRGSAPPAQDKVPPRESECRWREGQSAHRLP